MLVSLLTQEGEGGMSGIVKRQQRGLIVPKGHREE